jgi:hypothetical protein
MALSVQRDLTAQEDHVVAPQTMPIGNIDGPVPEAVRPNLAARQMATILAEHRHHLDLDLLPRTRMAGERNAGCGRSGFHEIGRAGKCSRLEILGLSLTDVPAVDLNHIRETSSKM